MVGVHARNQSAERGGRAHRDRGTDVGDLQRSHCGRVDVTLTGGETKHFSLTLEDQLNLLSLQGRVASGADSVPYHADGEECSYYSAADFGRIADAATRWKLYQESYFNALRGYILALETVTELRGVTYGMDIPEAYRTDVLRALLAQQETADVAAE